MSNNIASGLTSIIVPCWNGVEFTQQCIAALKSHTRPAWELIVVDNGSTDGTGTYLAGVRDMSTVPVTVVSNATNVGFPAAINQGLRLARGEYLVMLNNDVVVTDGWLDQLIALVNAKRSSVVSGPLSVVADGKPAERERPITPPVEQPQIAPPYDGDALHDAGAVPASSGGIVPGSAVSTTPPYVGIVPGSAGPTPPGPPFTRGGKVMVRAGVDSAGAGIEAGEPGAAPSSLPTAYCRLFAQSGWSGLCPITRLRRSWWKRCHIMVSRTCTGLQGNGASSTLGRGSTRPSCQGFVCS
jgi:hypothetical protein